MVAFTGSVESGKRGASLLGDRRAILELGGNDPLIILADADLDAAVRLAVQGCYANSGQRCTTVKQLIVAEPVADVFARRFTEASAAIRVGDPHHDATDMGTVISEEAARQLEASANDAIAAGATLLHGNRRRGALRCGTVNVGEAPGYRTEATPFGGTKDSGIGVKEGVVEAMKAMTFTKLYSLPWE